MPYMWIDDESYGQLKRLAALNNRKLIAEIRMMLEARLAGIVSQPNVGISVEEAEHLSGGGTPLPSDQADPVMQPDLKLLVDRIIRNEEVSHAE